MKPNQLIVIFIHYLNEKRSSSTVSAPTNVFLQERKKQKGHNQTLYPNKIVQGPPTFEAKTKTKTGKLKKEYNVHLLARSGTMRPTAIPANSYSLMPSKHQSYGRQEMNWTHVENESS
jgi:hypothetical protein